MSNLEKRMNAVMRLCIAEDDRERRQIREEIRQLLAHGQATLDPEQEIQKMLMELGAPDHLAGYPYVVRGILLVMEDRMYINNMTFGLYPQLAAEFDTTVARTERAIRHLIEQTWARGNPDKLDQYFGTIVSASRGKPTNGEFIARMANLINAKIKEAA